MCGRVYEMKSGYATRVRLICWRQDMSVCRHKCEVGDEGESAREWIQVVWMGGGERELESLR